MPLAANPKQIDQSTIPPIVRRQAEAAEALRRRAAGEPEPGQQPPQEPPQPPQEGQQPPAEAPPAPEQRFKTTVEDAPPAPPQGDPEPPKSTQLKEGEDPNADTWHHKFVSEQGRTTKLRADLAQLSSEVTNLRGLLATMQEAQAHPQPAQDKQQTFKSEITPEEIEQWGPDLLAVIEKKAREIAHEQTSELRQQVQQLGGQVHSVGGQIAQDARGRMVQNLDSMSAIEGWRDINTDPEFMAWLQYPDRLSGKKRHAMLVEAWDSNNASRVAAFFEDFLDQAGRAAPQPVAPQGNGAAKPQPKPSLESLAAPGKSRSAAPPLGAAAGKDIITTGDIARYYADSTAGRFKGREADAEAYEREIFAAQNEGRVRPGPPSRS